MNREMDISTIKTLYSFTEQVKEEKKLCILKDKMKHKTLEQFIFDEMLVNMINNGPEISFIIGMEYFNNDEYTMTEKLKEILKGVDCWWFRYQTYVELILRVKLNDEPNVGVLDNIRGTIPFGGPPIIGSRTTISYIKRKLRIKEYERSRNTPMFARNMGGLH